MTPENFCYWLQGFFEISKVDSVSAEQVEEIKRHLQLVFNRVGEVKSIFPGGLLPTTLSFNGFPPGSC